MKPKSLSPRDWVRTLQSVLLTLCLFGVISSAHANDPVGRVVLATGDVWIINLDNERREVKRGDEIQVYDTIITGMNSKVHLRFTDGSSTRLTEDARFRVAEYYYRDDDPDRGSAVFQLLKGGLRTISGKIGAEDPERYRLQTTLATIGIRGTEYEAFVCDLCCAMQSQKEEGVAGGVEVGGINVDTAVGAADLDPGQYFVIRPDSDSLEVFDYRPPFLGGEAPVIVETPEPVQTDCTIIDALSSEAGGPVYERACLEDEL